MSDAIAIYTIKADEEIIIGLDWTAFNASASISTSVWTPPSPFTLGTPAITGQITTVLVKAPSSVARGIYLLENTITNSLGEKPIEFVQLRVV